MSGSVQQPLETIDYLWVLARQVDRVAELCTGVFKPDETPQKLRARACLGSIWVLAALASPLVNVAEAKRLLREAFQALNTSVDEALRKAPEALEALLKRLYEAGFLVRLRTVLTGEYTGGSDASPYQDRARGAEAL